LRILRIRCTVFYIVLLGFCVVDFLHAQQPASKVTNKVAKSAKPEEKTPLSGKDSLAQDSLTKPAKKGWITAPINYEAEDSMILFMDKKSMSLYGKSKMEYQKQKLESYNITTDMQTGDFDARPLLDTNGKYVQKPVFTDEKGKVINATGIKYNVNTEKGIIYQVRMQEGQGYILADSTKRHNEDEYHLRRGDYTTCDLEEPHFGFHFSKMIMYRDDKLVTGLGYAHIEDIPFFPLPSLIIPAQTKKKAGILVPSYNQSNTQGFYLTNLGWYQPIGNYVSLKVLADIYTRGSWKVEQQGEYKVRYKVNGRWNFQYQNTVTGNSNFNIGGATKTFKFNWNHNQDPKMHPYYTFTARVEVGSSSFSQYDYSDVSAVDYLKNEYTSDISFGYKVPNVPVNMTLKARHSQKTREKDFSITLPEYTLTYNNPIYLFKWIRGKNAIGAEKWYEKINLGSLTFVAKAQWNTKEDIIFGKAPKEVIDRDVRKNLKYGVQLPTANLSADIKLFKGKINMRPSISENHTLHLYRDKITAIKDENDLLTKLDTTRSNVPSFTASARAGVDFSTKITGIWIPGKGKGWIGAFRHTINPTIGFSGTPRIEYKDKYVVNTDNDKDKFKTITYDPYAGQLYGAANSSKSASVNFSITSSLEAKIRAKNKDGKIEYKRVKIIDNFTVGSSYNFIADSLRLNDFTFSASTKVFDWMSINYNGTFSPYVHDKGRKINKYLISETSGKTWARMNNSTVGISFPLSNKKWLDKQKEAGKQSLYPISISANLSYNLSLSNQYQSKTEKDSLVISAHTMSLSGNIDLTKNWKITYATGYDFNTNELSYTSLGFTRDLHCWTMGLTWVPFGARQSYTFNIRVKSSMLANFLKLDRRRPWFDGRE
jgi:lipopolysaccharide assembly outer membrane protein LptD (OstA)